MDAIIMVMAATTNLLTFEEFTKLPEPDQDGKVELLEGEVNRMPPAFTQHMRITLRVYEILRAALRSLHGRSEGSDLGEVFAETGYRIGSNWLIPDVSITHAGQPESQYLEGAPALAIEVVSEGNSATSMHRKIKLYLDNGAREVWAV